MSTPRQNWLDRIDRGVAKIEAVLVTVVLFVMLGLSTLQLVLHTVFDSGIEWADIVARQMVLWLGFLGGALATQQGRHIAIDAASKLLGPRPAAVLRVITFSSAALIAAIMGIAAYGFVRDEMAAGSTLFGSVPAWPFQAVMPVSLFIIVFHFTVSVVDALMVALGRREPVAEDLEAHT